MRETSGSNSCRKARRSGGCIRNQTVLREDLTEDGQRDLNSRGVSEVKLAWKGQDEPGPPHR